MVAIDALGELMHANPHLPGISSEGGQDYFCSVYQRQLQKFVDARYPHAREYRKPLTTAFLSMVHYIEEIYHHDMIKHLYERTAADAEWVIYQGKKDNCKLWRETGYDSVAIERLALIMADGSGKGPQFEKEALPHLHRALQDFIDATTDEEGLAILKRRDYFAHALIQFMTDLI